MIEPEPLASRRDGSSRRRRRTTARVVARPRARPSSPGRATTERLLRLRARKYAASSPDEGWAPGAGVVAAVRSLDLDHVGAEVREHHRRERSRRAPARSRRPARMRERQVVGRSRPPRQSGLRRARGAKERRRRNPRVPAAPRASHPIAAEASSRGPRSCHSFLRPGGPRCDRARARGWQPSARIADDRRREPGEPRARERLPRRGRRRGSSRRRARPPVPGRARARDRRRGAARGRAGHPRAPRPPPARGRRGRLPAPRPPPDRGGGARAGPTAPAHARTAVRRPAHRPERPTDRLAASGPRTPTSVARPSTG